ncbi:MAG: presenilin family intramembrane aspartyl protease PSH [Halodesulfurarchaeum sp.]
MTSRRQMAMALLGAVVFFLAVQIGALALVEPFREAGYRAVENPQNPMNSVLYLAVILIATALMLVLFRLERTGLLRAFLVATSGLIAGYVFSVLLPAEPTLGPTSVSLFTVIGVGLVIVGLLVYPEWWVIDASALIMGMGAAALFGISFDVLPAILLLSALAVYDAISVYGTEHMLSLASGVMELRVPVIVIIPTTLGYSFIEMADEMASDVDSAGERESNQADSPSDGTHPTASGDDTPDGASEPIRDGDGESTQSPDDDEPFERDAFFIGLGDAVMPTILVASATAFLDVPTVFGIGLPSLGAMTGTLVGLLVLLRMVLAGRPHAGLPLLNGGAIGGYIIGAFASGIPLLQALGLAPYL